MLNPQHQKVTAKHLSRKAFLYVRQSTLKQVCENTESTKRQYALRGRAIALGWPDDHVVVIDDDLGKSGASSDNRLGFQRLVSEVGLGHAGIVLGLEVSRLARNSADWHRLLEICALTNTLILDEDGLYDPADFNDRLLLGMKRDRKYQAPPAPADRNDGLPDYAQAPLRARGTPRHPSKTTVPGCRARPGHTSGSGERGLRRSEPPSRVLAGALGLG